MSETTVRHGYGWIVVSSVLLVLCLVLTGMVLSDNRTEQNRETVYMRTIYYDLRDIASQAQRVSQMESFDGNQMLELYHLQVLLKQTDGDFSKDASYLTGKNPSAFGIWFSQQASKLHTLSEAEPVPAERIRDFAGNLQANAEKLYQPFVGEDGLNFDNTIPMEEFTDTISDVHDSLS